MPVKPLPKWAMLKYARLWSKFHDKEFTFEQCSYLLKEKNQNLVSVLFSYLRKYGWLSVKLHPTDMRKKIYSLKSPEQAIKEMSGGEK